MKVTFIYSQFASHWLSCQTITRNLLKSYAQYFSVDNPKKSQIINFNKDTTLFDTEEMASAISSFNPDVIVFLDHSPHPWPLLRSLNHVRLKNRDLKLPRLVFHVYGDFPLMSEEWIKSQDILKNYSINWICASDNQVKLIQKFIKKNQQSIYKVPFPVDQAKFFNDDKLKARTRRKLGIENREVVFVYSGRISYQKRIQDLLDLFEKVILRSKIPVRLLIVGPFDSLGNPYTGEYFKEGEFAQKLINYFNFFTPEVKSRITYLGCVEEKTLNEIYNASDIFVSLSTHNDEDFGMSPAEALCTGLPAILTNWGGYSSFKHLDNRVELVATQINESKALIDISLKNFNNYTDSFIAAIEDLRKDRPLLARKNQDFLSVESVAPILKKIMMEKNNKFEGFSSAMGKFDKSFKGQMPFVENHPRYNQFYTELYESYISKKS